MLIDFMANARRQLANMWRRVSEACGWPFYTHPQTYDVQYVARLSNRSALSKTVWLVLPVPPETPCQHVSSGPEFDVETSGLQTEQMYNNRYVTAQVTLDAQQEKKITQSFRIRIKPNSSLPQSSSRMPEDTAHLHPHDKNIMDISTKILSSGQRGLEAVKALNGYVIDRLQYGDPIDGLYSDLEALERPRVDCGGFSTLLISLCAAAGMPGRLACGFWVGHQKNDMHAWAEILTPDNVLVPVDPSIEKLSMEGRTSKSGRLGSVGSDRLVLSYGCDFLIAVGDRRVEVDILQHPVVVDEAGGNDVRVHATVTSKIL